MKRLICAAVLAALLVTPARAMATLEGEDIAVSAPSAVLMEKESGAVIYEKAAHERLAPASVTKVMTMLLIAEAIESGRLAPEDIVTASARAASMGGSQIWLEEGERMTVRDMLKCIAVSSANDCAVAMAEHISGTEEAFVRLMNERAAELGMEDTSFLNCTGLSELEGHYTSAWDVAVMSRELIRHDMIKEYTTIWMDTVRNGEFGLSSTNKLIFHYPGATGLKTGFTNQAMFCLAATAERDGVEYIAVVMHAATSVERFESAKTLLNYAFANYELLPLRSPEALPPVRVELGEAALVQPEYSGPAAMLGEKGAAGDLSYEFQLPESVSAPVRAGDELGRLIISSGGAVVAETPLVASESVEALGFGGLYLSLLRALFCLNGHTRAPF